ncbi:MAG: hypothetical protein ABIH00_00195 [Armatimonadota bacterium]
MEKIFNTVLLLALPASGKSEVRKYLDSLSGEELKRDFHMGDTLQLDDYLYVHMMREIDENLRKEGLESVFFYSNERPFIEKISWGVLIHLVNEDYDDLMNKRMIKTDNAAEYLCKRYDAARIKLGAESLFYKGDKPIYPEDKWNRILKNLESESRRIIDEKHAGYPDTFDGKTIVMEFARGGEDGSSYPLPWGYQYCLGQLHPDILSNAVILYVWVTPEESRRKNQERAKPNASGSILHHGVPEEVMYKEYGCDDINYLIETSDKPGFVKAEAVNGKAFYLPIGKFDNRVDKTSFIRNNQWKPEEVKALHDGIKAGVDSIMKSFESVNT